MPAPGRRPGPWGTNRLPCPGLLPIAKENQIGGGPPARGHARPKPRSDVVPGDQALWPDSGREWSRAVTGLLPGPDVLRGGLSSSQTKTMARCDQRDRRFLD